MLENAPKSSKALFCSFTSDSDEEELQLQQANADLIDPEQFQPTAELTTGQMTLLFEHILSPSFNFTKI